jgi:hypothetical protein
VLNKKARTKETNDWAAPEVAIQYLLLAMLIREVLLRISYGYQPQGLIFVVNILSYKSNSKLLFSRNSRQDSSNSCRAHQRRQVLTHLISAAETAMYIT